MRKQKWFYLAVVLVLLLTACSQATSSPGGSQVGASPKPTGVAVATQDPNAKEMACTVVSKDTSADPTQASLFGTIGKDEWVLGSNPNATMTIIEYSDFM